MASGTPARAGSLSSVPDRVLSPTRSNAEARRAARREQLRDFYGLKRDGAASPGAPASPTPSIGATLGAGPASPSVPRGKVGNKHSGGGTKGAPAPADASASPKPTRTRSGPGSARADRRDHSSPNFVPAEYYEDLLGRAGLAELLKTTSKLATDVGRLHSSRHTLVYNHHHQLFAAGESISVLNTRTPQLLSIVTDLQERFSEMSQLADSVALPERPGVDDEARTRAVAKQGLERVRLMRLADAPDADIARAWSKVEDAVKLREHDEALDAILAEGRTVAGLDESNPPAVAEAIAA